MHGTLAALCVAASLAPAAALAQPSTAAPARLSLSAAVARAVARNPSAEVARAEVRRAEALVEAARAASLPTLTANAVYTRLDDDRVLSGRVIAGADQLAANVTLTVPIVAPQRWAQWSHARDNAASARASASESRWLVAAATARAWLTALAQRRSIESLARARDAARAHRDFAAARFEGGVGNRVDVVRAGQELAVTEAQLQSALAGVARAREALGVLLGADDAVDVDEAAAELTAPSEAAALASAGESRPDVLSARARSEAAGRVLRDSWVDYLPTLTGVAQPFYQNPPTLTQPLTGWQAQVVLSLPLYDGGLRYGARREREALAEESRLQLEAATRQARADVRAAAAAVRQADLALDAARDAARLADETLTLAQEAYRGGTSTNLEVIDAERRARDAATAVVVAEDAARQGRLELILASGRLP
ncbi:MAG: TolC family protein [Polyangiales bacterium]